MVSKKGFIEEDSSIISTMIARGKKNGLSPEESVLRSDYLPTSSSFRQVNLEDRKDTLKDNHCDKVFPTFKLFRTDNLSYC